MLDSQEQRRWIARAGAISAVSSTSSGCRRGGAARTNYGWFGIDAHSVKRIRIGSLVADAVSILVDPSDRLLKQAGLRIAFGHRPLHDVELVFVHCHVGKGA